MCKGVKNDKNIVEKYFYSCFWKTNLEQLLKSKNIKNIYWGGLTINTCLHYCTKHSKELGFNNIVLKDLVITHSQTEYTPKEQKGFQEHMIMLSTDLFTCKDCAV